MFDLEPVRLIIVAVASTLLFTGFRMWAPKAAARRLERRGSIVGPALKPTYEQQAMNRSGLQMQELASRKVHDDMLAEGLLLKLQARSGTNEERLQIVGRAIDKLEEAVSARPGSYESTKLLAELFLEWALLTDEAAAVAPLQRAARLFEEASSLRPGVIDNYIGRGWSYLEMTRVDPEWAGIYAVKAIAGFIAGFDRIKQNVFVVRGWGLAVDRYARSPEADAALLADFEADYRGALVEHRDGRHDLFGWYDGVRRAATPAWVDVPALRDVT
jgi:hypothetical protein